MRTGQVVNIGTEMVNAFRNGDPIPVVVEIGANDSPEIKNIKHLILQMTKYHSTDRKSIFEVENEMAGKYNMKSISLPLKFICLAFDSKSVYPVTYR